MLSPSNNPPFSKEASTRSGTDAKINGMPYDSKLCLLDVKVSEAAHGTHKNHTIILDYQILVLQFSSFRIDFADSGTQRASRPQAAYTRQFYAAHNTQYEALSMQHAVSFTRCAAGGQSVTRRKHLFAVSSTCRNGWPGCWP